MAHITDSPNVNLTNGVSVSVGANCHRIGSPTVSEDRTVGRRQRRSLRAGPRTSTVVGLRRPGSANGSAASTGGDSGFASTGPRTGSTTTTVSDAASVGTTVLSDLSDSEGRGLELHGVPPGVVGIRNHHNTCFISAAVQCLSNTAPFLLRVLEESDGVGFPSGKSGKLGEELSRLLRAMWTGRYGAESSRRFHRVVRAQASSWYDGREQTDALEFTAWLLDRLRTERFGSLDHQSADSTVEKPVDGTSADVSRDQSDVVTRLFGATCRSTLICPGCDRQSSKSEPFLFVSLPILSAMPGNLAAAAAVTPGKSAATRCTVFVTVVRGVFLGGKSVMRYGFRMTRSRRSTVARLKRLIARRTGIPVNQLVLAVIRGHEFQLTLHVTQVVPDLSDEDIGNSMYAFHVPAASDDAMSDDRRLIPIILLSCDARKAKRYASKAAGVEIAKVRNNG